MAATLSGTKSFEAVAREEEVAWLEGTPSLEIQTGGCRMARTGKSDCTYATLKKEFGMEYQPLKAETFRQPDWPIESLFVRRWSPRAMNAESLAEGELNRLFEAARWAPSSYNEQEWRFLYAERKSEDWPLFFNLLMEANQVWCRNAAALIVVVSKKTFTRNGKPNGVHSFDAGLATQNLLLQAASMNLVGHGMAGFDRNAAQRDLEVPDD